MQRLSGLDATFLYLETPTQPLHVCGLIVVDPTTIPGGYSFERFRRDLELRSRSIPGFRRKVRDSRWNLDHPVWEVDDDFDIERHCHRATLPAPHGDAELRELCGDIASTPLERDRPLWEMWVIEGLADGSIAIMAKMHHAGVDGVTGADMMGRLCGLSPDTACTEPDAEGPDAEGPDAEELGAVDERTPGTLDLAVGGLVALAARPLRLVRMLPGGLAVLPRWIERARRGCAMPAPFTAPRTSLNGTISGERTLAYTQLPFEDVLRVKRAFGVTVNDVVLTLCSAALRRYLQDRDELPDRPLVAVVPVSVHGKSDRPGTNQVSGMFARLATDIADPVERLRTVGAHNSVVKDHSDTLGAHLLQDLSQFSGHALFSTAMRVYGGLGLAERHPVIHNLVISNIPGPPVPLYFMGARIRGMYPLGPIFHGAALNVTAMSLDGHLDIGLVGCRRLLGALPDLADAFGEALDELVAAARAEVPEAVGAR
ncbi:wax ester/triacylglycerol synthase family O-acyltransferase [Rhodococcus triatomae]|uniref:Diacylglycerol O-acyltransferase n=1 Tax=Rhodococcus triatomae TaxID=300028 RepID=A0A1G8KPD7_9NOCA|nr:wax ester/triacylglycerol synthase family O-acyltransferase [Rhodococcus triatomae]QNG18985.1 wax ester/triacylglycerol synthase family O-acyltransferase [Rhodococcus triatomae]QNG25102.1 wax ester/triacylglycerol synthase family O-acyltransferase [Rhodococcus triatomae]SDI45246.1 acyltransferase, WS/DGAT/MGAT [Rhodococcus triatomae]